MGREGSSLFGWGVEFTLANYELGRLRVCNACTKSAGPNSTAR